MVSYSIGDGVIAEVQSERLKSVLRAVGWPCEMRSAGVVTLSLGVMRGLDHPDWDGPNNRSSGARVPVSPEHIVHALEDFERLILPSLDVLHTARDLWVWYQRPNGYSLSFPGYSYALSFPGFADESVVKAWLLDPQSNLDRTREAMYSARVLPDERYFPLLDAWEAGLSTRPEVTFVNLLKRAQGYRKLPQTPPDGPL